MESAPAPRIASQSQRRSKSSACDFGTACPLEAPACGWPPPDLIELQSKLSFSSRAFNVSGAMVERPNVEPPVLPTNAVAGPGWRWMDAAPNSVSSSATPSATSILTSEYDLLTDYEAGLSPVSYHYGGGYIPACGSPRVSPQSVHDASKTTLQNVPRVYSGISPSQIKPGAKLNTATNDPSLEGVSFSISGSLHAPSDPPNSSYSVFSRPSGTVSPAIAWKRSGNAQGPPLEQPKLTTSLRLPAPLSKLTRPRRASRKQTTKEDANFQCSVEGCGKFFSRNYNFKSHMETHDEQRDYPFPCLVDSCAKKFVRKTDLQRHHQSVHKRERNHRCDYCGRLFARKDTLRRHMEDGCSKRFDIETLDLRSEGHDAMTLTVTGALPLSNRVASSAKGVAARATRPAHSFDAARAGGTESQGQASDSTTEG